MPNNKDLENQLRQTRVWIQELEKSINDQLANMRRKIDDELLQYNKEQEATPIKMEDVVDPQMPELPEEVPFRDDEIEGHRKGTGKGEKN